MKGQAVTAVKMKPWFYDCVKYTLLALYKILFRFRHEGSRKIPPPSDKRGVILASNHASYLDPPAIGLSAERRITFLAKEYLFRTFLVGPVLRGLGAYPIKTQADDFRTIRQLLKILEQGRCVAVFPEGTRSSDGRLKEAESGIGFLAVKSASWVVPVYIQGTFQAFPRQARWIRCRPVKVYYGDGFIPAEDAELMRSGNPYAAVSARIMADIRKLKETAAP